MIWNFFTLWPPYLQSQSETTNIVLLSSRLFSFDQNTTQSSFHLLNTGLNRVINKQDYAVLLYLAYSTILDLIYPIFHIRELHLNCRFARRRFQVREKSIQMLID